MAVSALLRPQVAVLIAAAGLFFIALGTGVYPPLSSPPFSYRCRASYGSKVCILPCDPGGIKPCVSAFGGDQIELTLPPTAMRDEVLRLFFSAFYFAINLGSVFSTIFTPMVRSAFTYFWAFSLPAALMVVALGVFLLGTPKYVHHPPSGNLLTNVMRIIIHAIWPNSSSSSSVSEEGSERPLHKRRSKRQILPAGAVAERHWLDAAIPRFGSEAVEEVKLLLRVLVVFLPIPIFWSLFDQQASRWTFQAQKMDGRVGPFIIQPDQMQSWNALLVLIFIPLFDRVVYPGLESAGVSILPIRRMVAGMVGAALSFVLSALVQMRIDSCPTILPCVNILWQLPQYAVMTAGEILISITGLEFAYSHAPASMTSVVLSFWSLTVAVGNIYTVLVVGVIAPHLTRAQEFIFFSVATLMASLLLMYVGRNFTYVTSAPLEDGEAEEVECLMH